MPFGFPRPPARSRWLPLAATALLLAGASAACVTRNATTGEAVPRGDQRYPFERVEEAAKGLHVGMPKTQVLLMLGSPAEMDDHGNVWIYLPERYGVVVPARALRLDFQDGNLLEFGYRPILLGQRL